jgi:hypothetical protein
MQILSLLQKNKILLVALATGVLLGSGAVYMKLNTERSIFQEKMKEANKKIAFIQKMSAEEKNETTSALEERFQGELEKLQKELSYEKKMKAAQAATLTEQEHKIEKQAKDAKDMDEALTKTKNELQNTAKANRELDHDLKKMTSQNQALQADLKKTTKDLNQCSANNADLVIIAEELVTKYKEKGLGAVILEKEPLTQLKKVELEQLTQQYRDEIEQRKLLKKKEARRANDANE